MGEKKKLYFEDYGNGDVISLTTSKSGYVQVGLYRDFEKSGNLYNDEGAIGLAICESYDQDYKFVGFTDDSAYSKSTVQFTKMIFLSKGKTYLVTKCTVFSYFETTSSARNLAKLMVMLTPE